MTKKNEDITRTGGGISAGGRPDDSISESEKKYRELVENASSIILKVDTEGRITFFNEYAEHFFGFSEAEILGRSVIGTIVPETESTGRNMSEIVQEIVTHPETHTHIINENIRKNGKRVWVSWNNHALVDADGFVQRVAVLVERGFSQDAVVGELSDVPGDPGAILACVREGVNDDHR